MAIRLDLNRYNSRHADGDDIFADVSLLPIHVLEHADMTTVTVNGINDWRRYQPVARTANGRQN